jgi:cytochrome P450
MTEPFRPPVPAPPETALKLMARLRAFRTNPIAAFRRAAYEEMTVADRMLGRLAVLLNAPEAIHHVLVEHPERYARSAASVRIMRPITGQGLLLAEGEAWRWQRRTIAPVMAPRSLPVLLRHVAGALDEASGALARHAGPVDLLAALQDLTLEIAGRAMFSLEMRGFGGEMRRFLAEYAACLARAHFLDMMLPISLPAPHDLPRALFRRRWMRFVEGIVAARLAQPEAGEARDLFDLLRAARDPESGRGFTAGELREQVATMILAGHETTAVALFWACYLLAHAPDWQDALAAEATAVPVTPANAAEAATRLPRARAVLQEAMRLYPPAFLIVRQARVADRIGDLPVPPGSIVMIAPWVLHRHRALWRDPDAFDPTRFLPGAPAMPRFAYLPFGAGPRVCVGAQFALAEGTLALSRLARDFRLALAPGESAMPVGVITTQPDHPARFVLTPRAPAAGAARAA